jgi:hypothetical protein
MVCFARGREIIHLFDKLSAVNMVLVLGPLVCTAEMTQDPTKASYKESGSNVFDMPDRTAEL